MLLNTLANVDSSSKLVLSAPAVLNNLGRMDVHGGGYSNRGYYSDRGVVVASLAHP
jgi:hypothetical protein